MLKFQVLLKQVGENFMSLVSLNNLVCSINNAILHKKKNLSLNYSNFVYMILIALKKPCFLDFKVVKEKAMYKKIIVTLFDEERQQSIFSIKSISKPSLPIYMNVKQIKNYFYNTKMLFFSTNKGILNHKECLKLKTGGLCLLKVE